MTLVREAEQDLNFEKESEMKSDLRNELKFLRLLLTEDLNEQTLLEVTREKVKQIREEFERRNMEKKIVKKKIKTDHSGDVEELMKKVKEKQKGSFGVLYEEVMRDVLAALSKVEGSSISTEESDKKAESE